MSSSPDPATPATVRTYANITWEGRWTKLVTNSNAIIVSLSEIGDSMQVTMLGIGVVNYSRSRDSAAIAQVLEEAARVIRRGGAE